MRFLAAILLLVSAAVAQAAPLSSRDIYLIDGDTADIGNDRFRLVGYDTPETYKPRCRYEKALGDEATRRARQLVHEAGTVDFIVLPGRDKYGRGLARIFLHGHDLGNILISEGLARPYRGGRRQSWCN
ncbi:thermonuclease family protein [Leisingera aquaemixtae]|uniref:thermonuclease family protein n=1 Tax=Leisingera TaxID=191028 RepID=UPI00114EC671|nr:thermonuclease family protein [Leisingera aquaemixtae]